MHCKIAKPRRPRRHCPAVSGEICPLYSPYLLESRKHDRPEPANLRKFPNQDIRLTETFLRDHEPLLIALGKGYWPRRYRRPARWREPERVREFRVAAD